MQITSTTQRNFPKPVQAPQQKSRPQPQQEAEDSYQPSGSSLADKAKGAAIIGGLGLAGAALGAFAGNSSGVVAGIAGAAVGITGGASLASRLPGEHIGTGAVLGAIGGGILAASTGDPISAVGLGIAGATLPYGSVLALASMLSV